MRAAFFGAAVLAAVAFSGFAVAGDADHAPPPDPVAALQAQMKAGASIGPVNDRKSYLHNLLQRLGVPEDSQVLVFSKTSLQKDFISPSSPRAIYFNDSIAVGSTPGAPLIEIAAVGRDGRTRFYALQAATPSGPELDEARDVCFSCHVTANPAAPGMVVDSVLTLTTGDIFYDASNSLIDARSPFDTRWGGWYVTGLHGAMKHRGNLLVKDRRQPLADQDSGNVTDLSGRFNLAHYLRPTSDIVALMTLEHQVGFDGLAALLNVKARSQENPDMDDAVGQLADYMLGLDQAKLTATVQGTSGFTERFSQLGPRDGRGRSLRDFDLKTRLFRYPMSFMIYSPGFDALEPKAKAKVYQRLFDVLSGKDRSKSYASIPEGDRRAALEIVAATKPDLPPYWLQAAAKPSA